MTAHDERACIDKKSIFIRLQFIRAVSTEQKQLFKLVARVIFPFHVISLRYLLIFVDSLISRNIQCIYEYEHSAQLLSFFFFFFHHELLLLGYSII